MAAAGVLGEGLGHEGCVHAERVGDFLDDGAEGHDVIGGLQGVGVAQVDFVLSGAGFVVAEFDGDATSSSMVTALRRKSCTMPPGVWSK